jgi:thiol-disulfide isomerase/thioredoxin
VSILVRTLVAGALLAVFCGATPSMAAELLTIGSEAPALDVEHWLQNGNGKFKPVSEFEPGKVYVVEFWATWCPPCVASMPHLAELQTKYADQGVQIVSISDEDLKTVEKFLERTLPKQKEGEEKTYRDLTSAYCLTSDPDQSTTEDYMLAAKQNGIPTSFIVGKDAKIEWIGHPMDLDETLAAVVDDTWNREKFAKSYKEMQATELARQEAEMAKDGIMALLQNKDFDKAIELIDETIEKTGDNEMKLLKLQVLLSTKKMEAATNLTKELFKSMVDDAESTNVLAWNLYEMAAIGRIKQGELLDVAIAGTTVAVDKAPTKEFASLLDTLAHLHFVNDNLDKAIEIETKAVKLADESVREFIEDFMKELLAAKAEAVNNGKKP